MKNRRRGKNEKERERARERWYKREKGEKGERQRRYLIPQSFAIRWNRFFLSLFPFLTLSFSSPQFFPFSLAFQPDDFLSLHFHDYYL